MTLASSPFPYPANLQPPTLQIQSYRRLIAATDSGVCATDRWLTYPRRLEPKVQQPPTPKRSLKSRWIENKDTLTLKPHMLCLPQNGGAELFELRETNMSNLEEHIPVYLP